MEGFIYFLQAVKGILEKAPGSSPGFSRIGFYPVFPSSGQDCSVDGWEKSWIWDNPGVCVSHGMGTCGKMVNLGKKSTERIKVGERKSVGSEWCLERTGLIPLCLGAAPGIPAGWWHLQPAGDRVALLVPRLRSECGIPEGRRLLGQRPGLCWEIWSE